MAKLALNGFPSQDFPLVNSWTFPGFTAKRSTSPKTSGPVGEKQNRPDHTKRPVFHRTVILPRRTLAGTSGEVAGTGTQAKVDSG